MNDRNGAGRCSVRPPGERAGRPVGLAGIAAAVVLMASVACGVGRADPAPGVAIAGVGERTVMLNVLADAADRPLEVSSDLLEWRESGLVASAGRIVEFPLARFRYDAAQDRHLLDMRCFHRPGAARAPVVLAAAVPALAGRTLGETGVTGGSRGYVFHAGGGGRFHATYQDPSYADSFYDMTWSVLDAQPGLVTLRLAFADGYADHLHLRFHADGAIEGVLTWDEGPGGLAGSDPLGLAAAAAPAATGGAPASLAGTDWVIGMVSGEKYPVSFATSSSASGPNLRTGLAGAWSYGYVQTGPNTGTVAVTDAAGNFVRFFLSFFASGESADFYAQSAAVQELFGSGNVFGTLTRD